MIGATPEVASAASFTWTGLALSDEWDAVIPGPGTTNWNTGGDTTQIPDSNDTATFDSNSAGAITVDLNGTRRVQAVTLSGIPPINLTTSTDVLELGFGDLTASASANTFLIQPNVRLFGQGDWNISQTGGTPALEVTGVISQSGGIFGITKSGNGTLILSGNNSYTGLTTISSGALPEPTFAWLLIAAIFALRNASPRTIAGQRDGGTVTLSRLIPIKLRQFGVVAEVVALVCCVPRSGRADVSYVEAGATYSQNFDTLGSAASQPWTDDSTIPGWFSNRTTYLGSNGSSTTPALYSFGTSAERALGAFASASSGHIRFGVRFMNDTGQTLSAFRVTYDGEQWRQAVNSTGAQQKLDFAYLVGSDPTLTSVGFVEVNELDFTGPIPASTESATALDGNVGENRVAGITQLITGITWPPGQQLLLRWTELNDGNGNDNGHAVDNFSFFAEVAATLPGDFNGDGTVDAADYIEWRKNDLSSEEYGVWSTHFAETLGGGGSADSGASQSGVPEPTSAAVLFVVLISAYVMRLA
jgi:autotransporter-associated beta strand protein